MTGLTDAKVIRSRRRFMFALSGLALVLVAAGCSTDEHQGPEHSSVAIGGGVTLNTPSPADLGRDISAAQSVILRFGEKQFLVETRLRVSRGRMLLVGLDTIGRRAFTLRWVDRAMDVTAAPWLDDRLPVRRFVADMVLIYWPDHVVRHSLAGRGGRLVAQGARRTVLNDMGEEVVRIDYTPSLSQAWSGRARYRNLKRGYEIDVRSAESLK